MEVQDFRILSDSFSRGFKIVFKYGDSYCLELMDYSHWIKFIEKIKAGTIDIGQIEITKNNIEEFKKLSEYIFKIDKDYKKGLL